HRWRTQSADLLGTRIGVHGGHLITLLHHAVKQASAKDQTAPPPPLAVAAHLRLYMQRQLSIRIHIAIDRIELACQSMAAHSAEPRRSIKCPLVELPPRTCLALSIGAL